MASKTLSDARRNKEDEFYTLLPDIENELSKYKGAFKNKVILCNCDDPFESNFFKYFAMNFRFLGLKKLIATCYVGSPVNGTQLDLIKSDVKGYKIEITEVRDIDNDGVIDLNDITALLKMKKNVVTKLHGDGDFRSDECVALLDEADIVVTNPPFSLFREYIGLLVQHEKKFIILSNQNTVTCKEIFPLVKQNKIWLGYKCGDMAFLVPDYYEPHETRYWEKDGKKYRSLGNICWITNLDIKKRHEELILYRNYNKKDYPFYENYKAINVNKVADIPCDYDGAMGVPITFLDKYNPEQFVILGQTHSGDLSEEVEMLRTDPKNRHRGIVNGKQMYARILIQRRRNNEN